MSQCDDSLANGSESNVMEAAHNSINNSAFPHPPWQYLWKSTDWHALEIRPPDDERSAQTQTAVPLDHVAARIQIPRDIDVSELQIDGVIKQQQQQQQQQEQENQEEQEYVLTVTLVSGHQGLGTDILMEVWKQSQPSLLSEMSKATNKKEDNPLLRWGRDLPKQSTTRSSRFASKENSPLATPPANITLIASRSLQWPAASRMATTTSTIIKSTSSSTQNNKTKSKNQEENKYSEQKQAQSKDASSYSLLALGLARRPPPNALAEWTNALDVLHWLSLDRTSGLTSVQREWLTHLQQRKASSSSIDTANQDSNEEENEKTGELLLFCLDTHSTIHVYRMRDLWKTQQHDNDSLQDGGMAAFMLGLELLNKVKQRIVPLTNPLQQVRLSWSHRADVSLSPAPGALSSSSSSSSSSTPPFHMDALFQTTQDGPSTAAFGMLQYHRPQRLVPVADLLCIAGVGPSRKRSHEASVATTSVQPLHGFCTFVSLRTLEEVRTVYLPFGPVQLYPWQWHGWIFVLCVGPLGEACAIRVDSSATDHSVVKGEAPSLFLHGQQASLLEHGKTSMVPSNVPPVRQLLFVERFQLVPVVWPRPPEGTTLEMVVGSDDIHCAAVYRDGQDQVQVIQYTFGALDSLPEERVDLRQVYARYHPPDADTSGLPAILTRSSTVVATLKNSDKNVAQRKQALWCYTRKGWGLLGLGHDVYWIGWQGQRQAVAYCQRMVSLPDEDLLPLVHQIHPLEQFGEIQIATKTTASTSLQQSSLDLGVSTQMTLAGSHLDNENISNVDELLLIAMESISLLNYRGTASPPSSPLRRFRKTLTQREKSQLLLSQHSGLTRLSLSPESVLQLNYAQPVVSIRGKSSQYLVTVRQADAKHAEEVPFDLLLSWLAHYEDYFTASSLALDLLKDGSSLRRLWESCGKINSRADNHYAVLEGILDGVSPVCVDEKKKRATGSSSNSTLIQLADMAIDCLTKGGYLMSSTLEHFVLHNQDFNASRAAVLLVATAACTLSDDPESVTRAMGKGYVKKNSEDLDLEAILWPVRALLNIGVTRDMLSPILALLNATIPDALRNRKESDVVVASEPSLFLCKALVTLIVGSSPDAAELLLGLSDEQSRLLYWNSLSHETQLELALVQIREDSSPMLFQAIVRNWVLTQLNDCLESEGSATSFNVYEKSPHGWLQRLVLATLLNARCSIDSVKSVGISPNSAKSPPSFSSYCDTVEEARKLILSSTGKFGVDFDILIGALLVLERRDLSWWDGARLSSRSLLNAACHFAGRRSQRESIAPLNAPALMRQCYFCGNVEAGANLIGGFNGLVLNCCDILVSCIGMEIKDAESFLLAKDFPEEPLLELSAAFVPGDAHYKTVWLLREYVLRISQYSDFVATSARGRVDPVGAARVCLRTWWQITRTGTDATPWLVHWLQEQLQVKDNRSPHRLACAALLRATVWPTGEGQSSSSSDSSPYLAFYLRLPNFFITQLALSACGLVETVPKEFVQFSASASVPTRPKVDSRPVLVKQMSDISL